MKRKLKDKTKSLHLGFLKRHWATRPTSRTKKPTTWPGGPSITPTTGTQPQEASSEVCNPSFFDDFLIIGSTLLLGHIFFVVNATQSTKLLILLFCYILALKAFYKPIKALIQNELLFFVLSVYHMKETGWEHICFSDVRDLHWKYEAAKAAKVQSS